MIQRRPWQKVSKEVVRSIPPSLAKKTLTSVAGHCDEGDPKNRRPACTARGALPNADGVWRWSDHFGQSRLGDFPNHLHQPPGFPVSDSPCCGGIPGSIHHVRPASLHWDSCANVGYSYGCLHSVLSWMRTSFGVMFAIAIAIAWLGGVSPARAGVHC
jgi:hypothetical protein